MNLGEKQRIERDLPKQETHLKSLKELYHRRHCTWYSSSGTVLQNPHEEGKSITGKYYRESVLLE